MPRKTVHLTAKQLKVAQAIDEYWLTHHSSPSVRDLCEMCGISSTSVCYWYLTKLQQYGLIELATGRKKGIVPAWVKTVINHVKYQKGDVVIVDQKKLDALQMTDIHSLTELKRKELNVVYALPPLTPVEA